MKHRDFSIAAEEQSSTRKFYNIIKQFKSSLILYIQ